MRHQGPETYLTWYRQISFVKVPSPSLLMRHWGYGHVPTITLRVIFRGAQYCDPPLAGPVPDWPTRGKEGWLTRLLELGQLTLVNQAKKWVNPKFGQF